MLQSISTCISTIGVPSDALQPNGGSFGQSSHVYIKVYDVSGKEIITLLDEAMEQGEHSALFNTNLLSKGVYLVKIISPAVLRDGIVHGTPFGENQMLIVQ